MLSLLTIYLISLTRVYIGAESASEETSKSMDHSANFQNPNDTEFDDKHLNESMDSFQRSDSVLHSSQLGVVLPGLTQNDSIPQTLNLSKLKSSLSHFGLIGNQGMSVSASAAAPSELSIAISEFFQAVWKVAVLHFEKLNVCFIFAVSIYHIDVLHSFYMISFLVFVFIHMKHWRTVMRVVIAFSYAVLIMHYIVAVIFEQDSMPDISETF